MTDVFNLIKNHKQKNKELLEVHDVDRDGNCFYRHCRCILQMINLTINFLESKFI